MKHQIFPTNRAIADVVKNLFADKYTTEEKLHVLSLLEKNKKLEDVIKKYHTSYYDESLQKGDRVSVFLLAEHIGAWGLIQKFNSKHKTLAL